MGGSADTRHADATCEPRGQLRLSECSLRACMEKVLSRTITLARGAEPHRQTCKVIELLRQQPGTRRVCGSLTPTLWTQTGQRLSGIRYSSVVLVSRRLPTFALHISTFSSRRTFHHFTLTCGQPHGAAARKRSMKCAYRQRRQLFDSPLHP